MADYPQTNLPTTTKPYVFHANDEVLIWYCHDDRWYVGSVVRAKGPELYEVEFCAGGPRIRDWYKPSLGYIKHNTADIRRRLLDLGYVLVVRTPRSR